MKTINYGGMEMTLESLLELADSLEKAASILRKRVAHAVDFDMPMSRDLYNGYIQKAIDRENEAQAIRRLVEQNS